MAFCGAASPPTPRCEAHTYTYIYVCIGIGIGIYTCTSSATKLAREAGRGVARCPPDLTPYPLGTLRRGT